MHKSYGELGRNVRGENGPKVSVPILAMDQGEFTKEFQQILRDEYGRERYAVQKIADDAGVNDRTAKNWWEGRCTPGALHLSKLEARNPNIAAAMRRLKVGHELPPAREQRLHAIREELDRLLEERPGL